MTQFYQLNGAERLAVELAEELNHLGIHADILSMYTEDLYGVKEIKTSLLARGIRRVFFLGLRIHPPIISMIPAIVQLRNLLREEKYDIIETSNISPTVLAAWATWGQRTKHLVGLHCVYSKDRENSLYHRFWRFSVRCNSQIRFYGISNFVTGRWISYFNTSLSYCRTIYNGISREYFEVSSARSDVRQELEISDQGRIIIYVGRLVKEKGIDTLFEAVCPLLQENDCYLLYIGLSYLNVCGSDELVKLIKKKTEDAGVQKRVKFLGFRKDTARLMASSDILVHPAQTEGFGLVLVEAMATGLQVVSSNVDGIPEVLKETDSIMVPPDCPDTLRKAVLEVLQRTPEAMENAISKGRIRAEEFRVERRTKEMITLFENMLTGDF
ncbi:glycosyl transferase group 1 [Candidatus Scalindua japonica]|uniref:Glycosyl transferase group 1 n=1 Tax=Candidatus Scalindua japonica TaxID=1284222 RepID=A0A286U474_9BACT|nr:glycosyltransferase family 4 protein [Candidatus Scalindua japonica]GAX62927.1 glycosyl transferase group 1 [Candidatus Scalindua japonica]